MIRKSQTRTSLNLFPKHSTQSEEDQAASNRAMTAAGLPSAKKHGTYMLASTTNRPKASINLQAQSCKGTCMSTDPEAPMAHEKGRNNTTRCRNEATCTSKAY
jgi:hypothetical protein